MAKRDQISMKDFAEALDSDEKDENLIKYKESILLADTLLKAKDLERAKLEYQKAAIIMPEEKYPTEKIKEIDEKLKGSKKSEVKTEVKPEGKKEEEKKDKVTPKAKPKKPEEKIEISVTEIGKREEKVYSEFTSNIRISPDIDELLTNIAFLIKKDKITLGENKSKAEILDYIIECGLEKKSLKEIKELADQLK
jgi:hypothetical protein